MPSSISKTTNVRAVLYGTFSGFASISESMASPENGMSKVCMLFFDEIVVSSTNISFLLHELSVAKITKTKIVLKCFIDIFNF